MVLSWFKKGVGVAVALEVASLAAFMGGATKMNRDPEFRYQLYCSDYGHTILDYFYTMGEQFVPDFNLRQSDLRVWRNQNRMLRNNHN